MEKQGLWASLVGRGAYDLKGTFGGFRVLAMFYFLTQEVATWLLKCLSAL